ncbi:MAG: cytochrome b/b6 domain-containing protein [Rhodobacteraceae bacterium]|nr:cytochrome b/b6 domain-containing protein [Paracoccaceae bacterium]
MALRNTTDRYGAVTKTFHWLTALLILTAIPLGWYATELPYGTSAELAKKAQFFSLHKTVGIAAFAVALLRILWALSQPRPAPLHPDRRVETWLAETVHWSLYAAMVVVPASGWITHAASEGFAPILWPLGQNLPLVPKSLMVEGIATAVHEVFTKVLILSILLHVAGAMKHLVIDRDATLARMLPGLPEVQISRPAPGHRPAVLAALAIYAAGFAGAYWLSLSHAAAPEDGPQLAQAESQWQVQEGRLGITVQQLGSAVEGSFADWTAAIDFTEEADGGRHGSVTVQISIPSLRLGSVTTQAMGPDFFAAETHPTAIFEAEIFAQGDGYVAEGVLDLKGTQVPVSLPFVLKIDGDTATMTGSTTLDRRDFGIGEAQTDPSQLGFEVAVAVKLTAIRGE